jgi:hypothetical protein
VTEPEVRVHGRRRRRSTKKSASSPVPPKVRSWLLYGGVTLVTAALMLDGFLGHRPRSGGLPMLAQAAQVRSEISESNDSLQVVVFWDLTLAIPAGRADSMRVKVATDQRADSLITTQSADQLADTLFLPVPPPGQTVRGVSCVNAEHQGEAPQESCTPWQYVRPSAQAGADLTNIVIQPRGLQVDPDVGGKCAQWQHAHPHESVWIVVNRAAVEACTGPNLKPTVAQFCAFAVLPDGRRVKTTNSANNPYCDELFEDWARERIS